MNHAEVLEDAGLVELPLVGATRRDLPRVELWGGQQPGPGRDRVLRRSAVVPQHGVADHDVQLRGVEPVVDDVDAAGRRLRRVGSVPEAHRDDGDQNHAGDAAKRGHR
jgi:hypothetical protein